MRKKIGWTLAIGLAGFALIALFWYLIYHAILLPKWIPAKPENSKLDFWLTQDVSSVDFGDYYECGWGAFGEVMEYVKKEYAPPQAEDTQRLDSMPEIYVSYTVGAYPDYAAGGEYVTRIEITDPDVDVFGVTCLSSFEEFRTTFEELGLSVTAQEGCYLASYDRVHFCLDTNKRVLSIYVDIANQTGIMF